VNGAELVGGERRQAIDGDDEASGARHPPSERRWGTRARTPRDRTLARNWLGGGARLQQGGRSAGWRRRVDGSRAWEARRGPLCQRVTDAGHQKSRAAPDERKGRNAKHDDQGGKSSGQGRLRSIPDRPIARGGQASRSTQGPGP
jgi:hypothetical protein